MQQRLLRMSPRPWKLIWDRSDIATTLRIVDAEQRLLVHIGAAPEQTLKPEDMQLIVDLVNALPQTERPHTLDKDCWCNPTVEVVEGDDSLYATLRPLHDAVRAVEGELHRLRTGSYVQTVRDAATPTRADEAEEYRRKTQEPSA